MDFGNSYEDNVRLLADVMGLQYPLLEDDLLVHGANVIAIDSFKTKFSNLEPGERLYLQRFALSHGVRAGSLYCADLCEEGQAGAYFADRQEKSRLARAIQAGVLLELVWELE